MFAETLSAFTEKWRGFLGASSITNAHFSRTCEGKTNIYGQLNIYFPQTATLLINAV